MKLVDSMHDFIPPLLLAPSPPLPQYLHNCPKQSLCRPMYWNCCKCKSTSREQQWKVENKDWVWCQKNPRIDRNYRKLPEIISKYGKQSINSLKKFVWTMRKVWKMCKKYDYNYGFGLCAWDWLIADGDTQSKTHGPWEFGFVVNVAISCSNNVCITDWNFH